MGWLSRAFGFPQVEHGNRRATQVTDRLEAIAKELECTTERLRALIATKESERRG